MNLVLDLNAQFPKEYNYSTNNSELRSAIYDAFGGICFFSGRKLSKDGFHIHHVIPKSKGEKIIFIIMCFVHQI